jgi:hypothetical protein
VVLPKRSKHVEELDCSVSALALLEVVEHKRKLVPEEDHLLIRGGDAEDVIHCLGEERLPLLARLWELEIGYLLGEHARPGVDRSLFYLSMFRQIGVDGPVQRSNELEERVDVLKVLIKRDEAFMPFAEHL